MLDSCREESPLDAVNPDTQHTPPDTQSTGRREGQARPLHDRPMSGPPHARGAVGWRVEPIDHPTRQLMDGIGCFQNPVGTWENLFRGAGLGVETEGLL